MVVNANIYSKILSEKVVKNENYYSSTKLRSLQKIPENLSLASLSRPGEGTMKYDGLSSKLVFFVTVIYFHWLGQRHSLLRNLCIASP
jgi:hypothetical protein